MKRFICSVVFLMLVNMTVSVGFAQKVKQNKVTKSAEQLIKTMEDTVRFEKAEAFSDGNGVLLKWQTEFESDNLGFNVYRLDGKEFVKVNTNIVPGAFFRAGKQSTNGDVYTFFDRWGVSDSIYRIENFSINGKNISTQTIYPKYESNLTNVGGQSSEEFRKAIDSANPVSIEQTPILPAELQKTVESNNSLTDINMQRWVASQPGVKIGVKAEGMYRVTVSELQAAGFDTNAPSANWQLYLNGIQQSINVVPGSHIEFFGKGIDTPDSDTNIYFLINGPQAGKRIGTMIRRGVGGNVLASNYEAFFSRRERTTYAPQVLNGDTENFFGAVLTQSSPATLNFSMDGIDFQSAKSSLEITLQGVTNVPHSAQIKLNGQVLGELMTGNNVIPYSKVYGIPTEMLQNGTNSIMFTAMSGVSDVSLIASIKINHLRLYQAQQNQLSFYTRSSKVTNVRGFTSPNVRVFDVTFPNEPTLITNATVSQVSGQANEYKVNLPANRQYLMFAVEDSAIKQVASIIPNTPSNISATNTEADMVIISYKDWMTESNNWATYRQNDGMNVKVVDVEDVYDEFGYGVKSSPAIKAFLQYTQESWQTSPDYVFLMGDASYDPRNYMGQGFHAYVPSKMIDTLYGEAGSDETMADFNNDGLSEIAIGRIPARNPQDVTLALNKTMNFESSVANAPSRGALCASDSPFGYDFAGLCVRVLNELPAGIPKSYVNRGEANANTLLLNAMNTGKYIVNYSGHGTTNAWAATDYFHSSHVASLNNADTLSIYTMLTCLNGNIFRPTTDSLSEVLLKRDGGGAVIAWASSGETTPDIQEVMARRFYGQLGNNPSMNRIGDLVKDAKTVINGGRDVRLSWVLLGDPTTRVK